MKKFLMFTLLIFAVLFTANAVTTPTPTAKDVGTEYAINLDIQNFDFVIILDQKDVKNVLQSEGLQNLKYPSLNSEFNYNLTTAYIFTDETSRNTGFVIQLKYPLLC